MDIFYIFKIVACMTFILILERMNQLLIEAKVKEMTHKSKYFIGTRNKNEYALLLDLEKEDTIKVFDTYTLRQEIEKTKATTFLSGLSGNKTEEARRFVKFLTDAFQNSKYCNLYYNKEIKAITVSIFTAIPSHIFFVDIDFSKLNNNNFLNDVQTIYNGIIDKPMSKSSSLPSLMALNYYGVLNSILFCLYDNCVIGYFNKFPAILVILNKETVLEKVTQNSKLKDLMIFKKFLYMAAFLNEVTIGKIATSSTQVPLELKLNKESFGMLDIFKVFYTKSIPQEIVKFMAEFDYGVVNTEFDIIGAEETCDIYWEALKHPGTTFRSVRTFPN